MPDFHIYQKRNFAATQPVEFPTTIRPTTGSPNRLTPVVLLPLVDLKAGDILDVAVASCQVSTPMTYNLMVGSQLILTNSWRTSPSWSQNDFGRWLEVTEAVVTNIDRNIHHHPIERSARVRLEEDWPNAHLILLVYAASDAWNGTSLLTVNTDYGRMEGTIERVVTRAGLREFLGLVDEPPAPPAPAPAPPAPAPEPPPPAPAPEPEPPAPAPEPPPLELITLQITPAQAVALQEVAAQIPTA